ncbi:plasmid partition protein ParG, partial [Citrobacter freundii]
MAPLPITDVIKDLVDNWLKENDK